LRSLRQACWPRRPVPVRGVSSSSRSNVRSDWVGDAGELFGHRPQVALQFNVVGLFA
jgi:hypothetical protein